MRGDNDSAVTALCRAVRGARGMKGAMRQRHTFASEAGRIGGGGQDLPCTLTLQHSTPNPLLSSVCLCLAYRRSCDPPNPSKHRPRCCFCLCSARRLTARKETREREREREREHGGRGQHSGRVCRGRGSEGAVCEAREQRVRVWASRRICVRAEGVDLLEK